jgi:hypothetical protein
MSIAQIVSLQICFESGRARNEEPEPPILVHEASRAAKYCKAEQIGDYRGRFQEGSSRIPFAERQKKPAGENGLRVGYVGQPIADVIAILLASFHGAVYKLASKCVLNKKTGRLPKTLAIRQKFIQQNLAMALKIFKDWQDTDAGQMQEFNTPLLRTTFAAWVEDCTKSNGGRWEWTGFHATADEKARIIDDAVTGFISADPLCDW